MAGYSTFLAGDNNKYTMLALDDKMRVIIDKIGYVRILLDENDKPNFADALFEPVEPGGNKPGKCECDIMDIMRLGKEGHKPDCPERESKSAKSNSIPGGGDGRGD